MTSKDREPSSEQPISAEWAGSEISIYDVNGILEDAYSGNTIIYDRSDFPFPIERVSVIANAVKTQKNENEEILCLSSGIQLDRTQDWDSDKLNYRFQKCLGTKHRITNSFTTNNEDIVQIRSHFAFDNIVFANSHLIIDGETGNKFLLWINHETSQVIITNKAKLSNEDAEFRINPKSLNFIPAEQQLTSLMKVTALVADLVNSFHINDPNDDRRFGIPLNRHYIVGKERRKTNHESIEKVLGRTGMKQIIDSDQNEMKDFYLTWDEEHGVERLTPEDTISLSDIGGLERVKKTLQDVATSFKHPEVMEKWGAKRPQGVLLYGEPGTGKTMLAQALAHEIGAEMLALKSTDIYEKFLGESEQRIKEIFNEVRKADKPTILFFDEFESIVGITNEPSSGGADTARNAVAGIFKQEMNTLAKENPNVLVVAATNNLDQIDSSLIRSGRFDFKVYVPMPDQDARQEIVVNVISKAMLGNEEGDFRVFGDDMNVGDLAKQTDGLSGADIIEIFRRLSLSRAMEEARTGQEQPPISQNEIIEAIEDFRTGV